MVFDPAPFTGKFLQEARELIQTLNDHLMAVEQSPPAREALRAAMRAAHTLKGSAKILRFQAISRLAHALEDVVGALYEGRIAHSPEVLDLLFAGTDLTARCVDAVARQDGETPDIDTVEALLQRAGRGESIADHAPAPRPSPGRSASASDKPDAEENAAPSAVHTPPASTARPEGVRIDLESLDHAIHLISEIVVSHRKSEREIALLKEIARLTRRHADHLHALSSRSAPAMPADRPSLLLRDIQDISAATERLLTERRDETAYADLLLNELHDAVLAMRMLPLSTVFQRFPRAIRDMARHSGKQVEVQIHGDDTALDTKIIEKLGTPLMHLLRNSLDHGIETPQERRNAGKSPTGRIVIQASRHSSHIEIRLADDGRGVQDEAIRRRLIDRGLFSEDQARRMDSAQLLDTIFLPGFSTSDIITDLSGRGFGMDIVKADIDALKGSISLASRPGQGMECLLTLPITLTSVRCLIVTAQGQRFAVPVDGLEETVLVERSECIRVIRRQAIRLRDQMMYVVPLAALLGLPDRAWPESDKLFVLVAHAAGKRVGLLVDDILDEQDVVQKPLPPHMRHVTTVTGATIASDNTVMLTLHVPELVKSAGYAAWADQPGATPDDAPNAGGPRVLLVEDSANTAEIERAVLESQGGCRVDVASDGLTALERLRETPYDLIVTDVEMPGMDGFHLTEQIRSLPDYAHVPVVILTSLEREADKRRGIEVGADAYLTKGGFNQNRLLETIETLLGSRLL